MRDSLRENAKAARETAKAAAQVAQGVLQAAAAEDDNAPDAPLGDESHSTSLEQTPSNSDWGDHLSKSSAALHSESETHLFNPPPPPPFPASSDKAILQHPPPPSFPPPPTANAPTSFAPPSGLPPIPAKPRRARASRYVVTGVKTTPSKAQSSDNAIASVPPPPELPTPSKKNMYPSVPETGGGIAPPPNSLLPPPPSPPPPADNPPIEPFNLDIDHQIFNPQEDVTLPAQQPVQPSNSFASSFMPEDSPLPLANADDNASHKAATDTNEPLGNLVITPAPPSFSSDIKTAAAENLAASFMPQPEHEIMLSATYEAVNHSATESEIKYALDPIPGFVPVPAPIPEPALETMDVHQSLLVQTMAESVSESLPDLGPDSVQSAAFLPPTGIDKTETFSETAPPNGENETTNLLQSDNAWNAFLANDTTNEHGENDVNWFSGEVISAQPSENHGLAGVFGPTSVSLQEAEADGANADVSAWPANDSFWPAPQDDPQKTGDANRFPENLNEPDSNSLKNENNSNATASTVKLGNEKGVEAKEKSVVPNERPLEDTFIEKAKEVPFCEDSRGIKLSEANREASSAGEHCIDSAFELHGDHGVDNKSKDTSPGGIEDAPENDFLDDSWDVGTDNSHSPELSANDVHVHIPSQGHDQADTGTPLENDFEGQIDEMSKKYSFGDSWDKVSEAKEKKKSIASVVKPSVETSLSSPYAARQPANAVPTKEPQNLPERDYAADSLDVWNDHSISSQKIDVSTVPSADFDKLKEEVRILSEEKHLAMAESLARMKDSENITVEYENLKNQVDQLTEQRNLVMTENQQRAEDVQTLFSTVEQLKHDLSRKESILETISQKATALQEERDTAIDEKGLAEKERDFAVETGGDGLREARSAIEEMRNSRMATEMRGAEVVQQAERLQSDLDRISIERNDLIEEVDGLKLTFSDFQSESKNKQDELERSLKIVEREAEIANLEKEKVIESSVFLKEEIRRLQEADGARVSALFESESRVKDLEMQLLSGDRDREEESLQIDTFTKQVEEMKERTRGIIEERNELYNDKLQMKSETERMQSDVDGLNRKLQDMQREVKGLHGEREEWKQQCESLREQAKDVNSRHEGISAERDRLVQERATEASSSSTHQKEKALAQECDLKTRAMAAMQRKLTSAAAKIEKLTTQKGTFQRQRDDAGARLRAAGGEFTSLNAKLEGAVKTRDELQNQMVSLRHERDVALTDAQEVLELKPQLEIYKDSLIANDKDLAESCRLVHGAQQEVRELIEDKSTLERKCRSLQEESSAVNGRFDVLSRERELMVSELEKLEDEKKEHGNELKNAKAAVIIVEKKLKESEADLKAEKGNALKEIESIQSNLFNVQHSKESLQEQQGSMERELVGLKSNADNIEKAVMVCLDEGRMSLAYSLTREGAVLSWPSSDEVLGVTDGALSVSRSVELLCQVVQGLCEAHEACCTSQKELEDTCSSVTSQLQMSEAEIQNLREKGEEVSRLKEDIDEAWHRAEAAETERNGNALKLADVDGQLQTSLRKETEFSQQLAIMKEQMRVELEEGRQQMTERIRIELDESTRRLAEEKAIADQNTETLVTKLQSIWGLLQKCIGEDQFEDLVEDANDSDGRQAERLSLLVLRASASVVAEVDRNREEASNFSEKLDNAEAEVERLTDRAEIAEQERDALRGTVERIERKANNAQAAGQEEARTHFEGIVSHLEEDLVDAHDNVARVTDKANRSEKEASELRALCNKLTSQLNGRTSELDEAEEKLAYLQDQVTAFEEDLQEAHRRLKEAEEESAEVRQNDVERLTKELEERTSQLGSMEEECSRLRSLSDEAEKMARESELVAHTHQQAEENLQIAIEQLEAAQESAVEQRTIELEKKLRVAEEGYTEASKREKAALVTENQLNLRDEEIKELRGAIGRLSDERVELKLELEKSLSRLNHPDAGGQLVDRRVVRQLLISYFRVGSVRRRDVLELMSRMLAFSEADNVAVGLKRRALMDRIGSLVQAPELDSATLPPLGTVSDKWIEFLMKETEEGEEQARRW